MTTDEETNAKPVNRGRGEAKKSARAARQERLSETLRANLARRKTQTRERERQRKGEGDPEA